jgi:hypothetical protein
MMYTYETQAFRVDRAAKHANVGTGLTCQTTDRRAGRAAAGRAGAF